MAMLRLRSGVLLLTGAVIWGLSAPATAETGANGETACIRCHKPSDTTIDPARYARSVHGEQDCAVCHMDGFSEFPHKGSRAQAPDCTTCHGGASPFDFDGIAQAVKESVHAQRVDAAFRCTNCHSPHYFVPATRMTDLALGIASANQGCLGCHASGASPSGARSALESLAKRHAALLPHSRLHLQANPCIACHADLHEREITVAHPGPGRIHRVLPAVAALKDCAACHGRNSVLATKLYAHLAVKERAEHGWLNAVLFNTAYVTGATRNRWLDWGTFGLTAVTILGIGVHGAGRWLGARLRRRS